MIIKPWEREIWNRCYQSAISFTRRTVCFLGNECYHLIITEQVQGTLSDYLRGKVMKHPGPSFFSGHVRCIVHDQREHYLYTHLPGYWTLNSCCLAPEFQSQRQCGCQAPSPEPNHMQCRQGSWPEKWDFQRVLCQQSVLLWFDQCRHLE